MSEPLSIDEQPADEIKSWGDGPPVNPTTYSLMMASNTGIGIFGIAGILFCLQELMQAFLIALLIVIALAIGNILLLVIGLRQTGSYAAAMRAIAKAQASGGTGATYQQGGMEARRRTAG
jgi:hypothetical protein